MKPGRGWRSVAEHVRNPLYRNGYLLASSSVLSSGFGMVFWLLAARTMEPAEVGLGSAAISALTFLANLASFNLVNALNRFVPRGGTRTRRLILAVYAVSASAAIVVGASFLVGVQWWSPQLAFLGDSAALSGWFVLAVVSWVVFVLQDGALTGLRASGWVTVENLVYAVAKIAILMLLARSATGLFLAWTLPVVPLVVVVNGAMFRRLLPRHMAATASDAEDVTGSAVRRFAAGDYGASLVWTATTSLLPVLVLERVGAAEAAYFYLAWTVAYVLYLVSRGFGMSMLTEAAADPARLTWFTYRTIRQTTVILLPAVAVVVAAAPVLLTLFGRDYSDAGAALLRLLALSAIPSIVTSVYTSVLRARRRIGAMVVQMTVQSIGVISLSLWLLEPLGIAGVGVAWLATHVLVAAALIATELRPAFVAHVDPRLIALLGRITNMARRSDEAAVRAVAHTALDALRARSGSDWVPLAIPRSLSDVRSVPVGPAGGPPGAILKVSRTEAGSTSLRRSTSVNLELRDDDRLTALHHLIPPVLGTVEIEARFCVLETLVAGTPADRISGPRRRRALEAAATIALELASATPAPGGEPSRFVRSRAERLMPDLDASTADRLERLVLAAEGGIAGVSMTAAHGDFWLGNLLVDEADRVAGVIDWDAFLPQAPADLDLVTLMVAGRVGGKVDMAAAVLDLLDRRPWESWERAILDTHRVGPAGWSTSREAVVLAWLHRSVENVIQAERYGPGSPWFDRQVIRVLNES